MSILQPAQVQAIERKAFQEGVSAEELMEDAGRGMAEAIRQFCPRPGTCLAVFGKGHNGGDALVAARNLSQQGWRVLLVAAFPSSQLAPLTSKKWDEAGLCETLPIEALEQWKPSNSDPLILLDGLLGIGAAGELRDPIRRATAAINALRERSHAITFALDLPTGLDGTTGHTFPDAVRADFTLTVAFCKTGLVADDATNHVGRLVLIPLEELSKRHESPESSELITSHSLAPFWKRRPANFHKGDCGRVAILAGNVGTVGAACLAANGALRSGAGLVTLLVPETIYSVTASAAPRECMVRPFADPRELFQVRADAVAVGPGIGFQHREAVLELISELKPPTVLDADALTILASDTKVLSSARGPRLLTPHPGEMERLDGKKPAEISRAERALRFSQCWPVTLLLKGAGTVISTQGRKLGFNTTGNPGMASGGMGDVLSGVCAGLLAQRLDCHQSACMGAWLCGRTAELLISEEEQSEESLLAGDIAEQLGGAFREIGKRCY